MLFIDQIRYSSEPNSIFCGFKFFLELLGHVAIVCIIRAMPEQHVGRDSEATVEEERSVVGNSSRPDQVV